MGCSFGELVVAAQTRPKQLEEHVSRALLDVWLTMIEVHEEGMEEHWELVLKFPISLESSLREEQKRELGDAQR